jgi:hypothetical protein
MQLWNLLSQTNEWGHRVILAVPTAGLETKAGYTVEESNIKYEMRQVQVHRKQTLLVTLTSYLSFLHPGLGTNARRSANPAIHAPKLYVHIRDNVARGGQSSRSVNT